MNHGTILYASPIATKPAPAGGPAPARALPRWYVVCDPHLRIRLKRWLEKLREDFLLVGPAGRSETVLSIADTPEAAHDLETFLARYPMEVQAPQRLAAQAERDGRKQADLAALLAPDYVPPTVDLAIPLRAYQRTAVDWAWRTGGLLLADDVGLGKTGAAIGTLTRPANLPAVVVTLPLITGQWRREIQRFAPGLRVVIPRSAKPADTFDLRTGATHEAADVIVTNYHKLGKLADWLARWGKSVVFDEAQELRHDDSAKYAAARHLAISVDSRLGLSATPIFNFGGEIFPVLECLAPGHLGTRDEFLREHCRGSDCKPLLKHPDAFGGYLRSSGVMLRRTRAEVGRELPKLSKVVDTLAVDLAAIDRAPAPTPAAELARIILERGAKHAPGYQLQAAGEFSMWLRQATGIAKAKLVAEYVRMIVEGSGEPVLLCGHHHAVYDLWRDALADLRPAFVTGRESARAKEEALRRFRAGEAPVLVVAVRAGAGLDGLQYRCRHVVFGELDYSPAVHEQAIGRLYRDGQAEMVTAYFLVASAGSDPVVADLLGLKTQQIEQLINPGGELFERAEVDEAIVRKLAADFLRRRGLAVPAAAKEELAL